MDKEKAKAYDEAIRKAKIILGCCDSASIITEHTIYDIFPELAESEDGRIRKEIISALKFANHKGVYDKHIAWLEKQGETDETKAKKYLINKGYPIDANGTFPTYEEMYNIIREGLEEQGEKPQGNTALEAIKEEKVDNSNKIEPKFNVGDWIVNEQGEIAHIIDMHKDCYGMERYYIEFLDGIKTDTIVCFVDEDFHLWTLQDAKKGDVVAYKGNIKYSNGVKYERICLFNNLDNALFTLTKNSNYTENFCIDVNIDYPDNTFPATKEQRDLLFKKMRELNCVL